MRGTWRLRRDLWGLVLGKAWECPQKTHVSGYRGRLRSLFGVPIIQYVTVWALGP